MAQEGPRRRRMHSASLALIWSMTKYFLSFGFGTSYFSSLGHWGLSIGFLPFHSGKSGALILIFSSKVALYSCFRYHLIKWKIRRYFKKTENDRHIEHYIEHCSLGDWLVLYQMSRNMNKRFFADQCHEHHHFIKDMTLETIIIYTVVYH